MCRKVYIGHQASFLNVREMGAQAKDGLQALSVSLVALGIIFGEDRLIGYTFIGAGVVLAIAWSLMARWRRRVTDRTGKVVRDE